MTNLYYGQTLSQVNKNVLLLAKHFHNNVVNTFIIIIILLDDQIYKYFR